VGNLKELFSEAHELIEASRSIVIVTHIHPDLDTLGSALALSNYLVKIGKSHKVYNSGGFSKKHDFLPRFDKTIKKLPKFYDLIIAVDCARLDRFGFELDETSSQIPIINIDHHVSNTNFGKINIIKDELCATALLIYEFFDNLDIEIDTNIATCIYTGIYDDSLGFSIDRVNSDTFRVVGELCKYDIEPYKIAQDIKSRESLAKYRLYPKVFDSLELYCEGKVAIVICKKEWLNFSGAVYEDAKDVVEQILHIKVVEVAILLSELPKKNGKCKTKVSLRTQSDELDMSKIASNYNGGGHQKASGFVCETGIEELKKELIRDVSNLHKVDF
jgi:phosphoesterase RecJ-like protein